MENRERWKDAAVRWWGVASCAVAASLVLVTPVSAVVKITETTTDGAPGDTVTLTMSLSRDSGDSAVASVQTDVIFDPRQIQLLGSCSTGGGVCQKNTDCVQETCTSGSCSTSGTSCQTNTDCATNACNPPCQKDARLTQQSFSGTIPDTVRPPDDPLSRVRLALLATTFPVPTISDGVLATCTFQVPSTAPAGLQILTDRNPANPTDPRFNVGDNAGHIVQGAENVLQPGNILPPPTPTATPSATATGPVEDTATPTVAGTPPTEIPGTPATETPTETGTPPTTVPATNTPVPPTEPPTVAPTGATPPTSVVPPTNTPPANTPTRTPVNTAVPTNTVPATATNTPVNTVPPTATRTSTPRATATSPASAGAGGGGGGGCTIAAADGGHATPPFALVIPLALLVWRRRTRG